MKWNTVALVLLTHCILANEEQVECAAKVVKSFTRNAAFNPDFFPNAGLNHHYQVLLAVAFNDEVPDHIEDKTVPNYALIKKVRGSIIRLGMDSLLTLSSVCGLTASWPANSRLERHHG